ncbi:hypothetical protein [Megavirus chiliensis]|uniref:Uncharacterized protein n=1 Tax=Megavirus chiliensis TaxID=1094892 RepID=A0AAJ6MKX1_9VIRU
MIMRHDLRHKVLSKNVYQDSKHIRFEDIIFKSNLPLCGQGDVNF